MANYKNLFFVTYCMKLLCFADVHADPASLTTLVRKARRADVLVCAGDLSLFGRSLQRSAQVLLRAGKPLLIVPGNHEGEEEVITLAKRYKHIIPLHRRVHKINDCAFFGFGGGGFSFREPEMETFARALKKSLPDARKKIFVTHAPPYHTVLDFLPWLQEHRGCKSTVRAIALLKPDLVLCGHFHETAGMSYTTGKTYVINPGRLGRIIEV